MDNKDKDLKLMRDALNTIAKFEVEITDPTTTLRDVKTMKGVASLVLAVIDEEL